MKKFKKLAALIIAAIMVTSIATAAFGITEHTDDGGIIKTPALPATVFSVERGEVVDFIYHWDNADELMFIVIQGEHGYIHLRTDFNTFMPDGFPEIGDTIRAFHDRYAFIPMIYPPQYLAHAITIEDEDTVSFSFMGQFDENMVSRNNEVRLIVGEDTEIIFQGGDPFEGDFEELLGDFGRTLFVEFTLSHRDINPTTILPERIVIMYVRIAFGPEYIGWDLGWDIDLDWDDYFEFDLGWFDDDFDIFVYPVTVNGVGLPGVEPVTVGDSIWPNYVPLRPIMQHLGQALRWYGDIREVRASSPRGEISFRIDQPYYFVTAADGTVTTYTLDVPVIINDYTYVPIRFFRDVYGFNNAFFHADTVVIDNNEVME
ncbi:MAG: copper amine oxidase N-terminal domain-containing protein [Defluviitaleaceae bacterium]|nr:copper amine oxidase N-terminal domain-containing protein [Defluviitaleaceae bacterium]